MADEPQQAQLLPDLPSRGKARRGKLRVHDPFALVRWLALSQTDPRKALAELVQNSLDAGARRVEITRRRRSGLVHLSVVDDGEGILPELERDEALRYIATHIGHSRKRSLSPSERLELLTQGQYGIGLLGFWSLGERLELRSWVPGQQPTKLTLLRDSPEYSIEALRGRHDPEKRATEALIHPVHKDALPVLGARRVSDYLGNELRGQIAERGVEVVVFDRLARGKAPRELLVEPKIFLGERVAELTEIEVPGHPPIRCEVFVHAQPETPLALAGAGTVIADSFAELGLLGLDREPWTDARLTGVVDFAPLRVAPGTRRGVVLDAASEAFAAALGAAAPVLEAELARFEEHQREKLEKGMLRDLRRAFRGFYDTMPRYALLPVDDGAGPEGADGPGEAAVAVDGTDEREAALDPQLAGDTEETSVSEAEDASRPLASVELVPARISMEPGAERRVRAKCLDADGRLASGVIHLSWSLELAGGRLEEVPGNDGVVLLRAPGEERPGVATRGELRVVARDGDTVCECAAPVRVGEASGDGGKGEPGEGIPDPDLVHAPGERWRSRWVGQRWQINTGHPQYVAIADRPALKVRYLALLFAKEVVIRSGGGPALEGPLEQLVEIATYADERLSSRYKRKRVTS